MSAEQTNNTPVRTRPTRELPFVIGGRRRMLVRGEESVLTFPNSERVALPKLSRAMVQEILDQDRLLLKDVKLCEIVAFLNNVGQNWKSEEYSRRRIYIRQLVDCLGYSQRMAELEANWIAMLLASHFRMYDLVATELGHRSIVDEWVPFEEARVRALPRGRAFHLLAGHVPMATVASLMRALVTKNVNVLKASSSDPFTPLALAMSFMDVDSSHPVARAVNVLHWGRTEVGEMQRDLLRGCDVVCAWGADEAIDWAAREAAPGTETLNFGPKRSIAVIGPGSDPEAAARALAHDICAYDQQACFSTQEAFVALPLPSFIEHLREALRIYARVLPKGFHDFDQKASCSLSLREAEFFGAEVCEDEERRWAIVVGRPGMLDVHPLGRTICLYPIHDLSEVADHVTPDVQTVAVSPWSIAADLRDQVCARGASRIVELGLSNVFRIGGAHDGLRPLQRLVRFVSVDEPASTHLKGLTVLLDQTKFLEENRFVEFIPT